MSETNIMKLAWSLLEIIYFAIALAIRYFFGFEVAVIFVLVGISVHIVKCSREGVKIKQ